VAIVDLLPGGFEVVLEKSRRTAEQIEPRQSISRERSPEQEEGESEGEAEERESIDNESDAHWDSPIGTDRSTWSPEFVDLREDRVVLFGAVGPSAQEFVYRIKATNKGKYVVPPAFAESMYDRSVWARTLAGTMVVEEKKADEKQQAKGK
jgi:hypothetical protein